MRSRRVIAPYPDAFRGTELDIEANRQRMEKLCAKRRRASSPSGAATPANSSQALAEMLREALAANTIGGRAGEETKWRAMAEDVRQAQSLLEPPRSRAGRRGPRAGRALPRACNRFFDQYRRKSAAAGAAAARGAGRGALDGCRA